jgi:hypothetical protein
MAKGYPVVKITRFELQTIKEQAAKTGDIKGVFTTIRTLSRERGLIYGTEDSPRLKKSFDTVINFRTWFDSQGNLCLQNYEQLGAGF